MFLKNNQVKKKEKARDKKIINFVLTRSDAHLTIAVTANTANTTTNENTATITHINYYYNNY